MGQYISTSRDNNNDELTNSLIKRNFIRTKGVEKAFRSVDRGFYYSNEEKHIAYRDSAWQSDQIHLSSPCVYAKVLECLELHPGLKFLNIGSGVGYFSTVAGLLLGITGVNHGIEIRSSLINYAYQKMEEFKLSAAAIDHHEFCEPVFIHGNACDLLPTGYYDRVYCGAGVPPAESEFMKSLVKIGGILVMPLEGFLVRMVRTDEHSWIKHEVLEVTFTDLVVPEKCSFNTVKFPSVEPLSLQELCRSNIRSILRENLKQTFPNLFMRTKCQISSISGDIKRPFCCDNDPLTQFIRIQYGVSEEGLVSLRNIVDTFAVLDDVLSDTASTIDEPEDHIEPSVEVSDGNSIGARVDREVLLEINNANTMNDPEDHIEPSVEVPDGNSIDARVERDEVQLETNNANTINEQTSDESTKRKTLEAGCSEQHNTSTETENSKRMKMDTPPQKTDSVPSTSSHSTSDIWGNISIASSESADEDSESWVSSIDEDAEEHREHHHGLMFSSSSSSSESDDDSDTERDLDMYRFNSKCKENELSQLLSAKIYLLPIPVPLKAYLNYNRTD